MRYIFIKQIESGDIKELSFIFKNEKQEYIKYFHPFNFDEESIKEIINKAEKDFYYGLFVNNNIIGLFMLRGLDEGYSVPSYGVYISNNYANLGLGKLTLNYAISICKLNKINNIMLKVHPNNKIAKKMYEKFGFEFQYIDKINSNLVYKLKI